MHTKRLVSVITEFTLTATLMLVLCAPAKENNQVQRMSGSWSVAASTSSLPVLTSDGAIRDEGIASEVVLAHE